MLKYQNILVFIDPSKVSQPALSRAFDIAKKESSAKITLFMCCYDLSYEMTSLSSKEERESMQQLVIKENKEWLESLIQPLNYPGISVELSVIWHPRPFQAAIIEILKKGYDLLIKATHPHSKLSAIFFTPTDWNLLRKCPVPVLLVKHCHWPERGNILCAIDCKDFDEEDHHLLNNQIINEAKDMSEIINAKVHLVNAYPTPPVNIMLELPEFDPIDYEDGLKKFHEKILNDYAQRHAISLQRCHLKQGLPEDVISKVACSIDAELVVLGTVGRSGFSATLLGHTAEQVIDNLDCDLLALKPEGFKSPITID
ncbi:universal stress protein UspE [Psychromonas sp. CNPT3]|uniref:universal stress protein UspE n=1 Tax=Psychromonas sp. CNPT3 TaxID=314282 RepID=UPI00006E7673|nr:universal stress protein UspE [Psychromonas sp. CNPT3]AGH81697.1 universal stress protein UspE [Psychromonas sp. CNPT3]